jgi:hypothetical protein
MDYNNLFTYKNGILYYKIDVAFMKVGDKAGTLRSDGYIGIYIQKKYHWAHRIIWTIFNGEIPEELFIDHIDGNRSNNLIENLRLCTTQENAYNRGKQSNNKSGYKGVSFHKQKQKWVAQIKLEGKNKFLGFFVNPEDAYEAYCAKAIEHYGEFASL